MENKKKMIIIVVALVVVAILAIVIVRKGDVVDQVINPTTEPPVEMTETQSEEAAEETQKIIDEIVTEQGGMENANVIEISVPVGVATGENGEVQETKTIKAVEVAPGNNLIDINSGAVIKKDGEKVNNAATPATQDAPSQSFPLTSADQLPEAAIKLNVTSNSFTPNSFTVKRGQVVILAVSNVNETTFSEIFRFDDPSLGGVVIGLAKGETKSITFNAPTTAGQYTFYSSMFDHRAQGAVGTMIVQ